MKRIWLAAAFLLAGAAARAADHALTPYDTPRVLPEVTVKDASGKPVPLSAFRGRVVVLDLWATWCLPCRQEFPALDRLQDRLGARGLVVMAVSIDRKGMTAVDEFYRTQHVAHLDKYVDDSRDIAETLGVRGLPTTLIVGRDGREAARVEGVADWDGAEVSGVLEKLLN